jgi:YHS domain-containing protein
MAFHDPVCGKRINRNKAHIAIEHRGVTYYLCCPQCQSVFEADPDRYARRAASAGQPGAPRSREP